MRKLRGPLRLRRYVFSNAYLIIILGIRYFILKACEIFLPFVLTELDYWAIITHAQGQGPKRARSNKLAQVEE